LPKNDGKIITNLMFSAFCAFRYKIDCRFARSGVLSSSKSRLSSVAIVALFRGVDDALIPPRETRVLPARLRSPG
jgi:hypothetical protein